MKKSRVGKVFVAVLTCILIVMVGIDAYKTNQLIEKNRLVAEEINKKTYEERKIKEEKSKLIKESLPKVFCWGDSLTAGAGGNGVTYSNVLAKLTNLKVLNYGVGGEGAQSIAMRQGAIPIYVEEFVIPSEVVDVEINLVDESQQKVNLLRQGDAGINPCIIDGVEGIISYNKDEDKYYYKRSKVGDEKKIASNTQLVTAAMNDKNTGNDILVIFSGTNNLPDGNTILNIIDIQRKMINYSNTDKYIIIGLTSKSYMPHIDEVNNVLKREYGEKFLDIRAYILENGLEDAGISITEQDQIDIENGEIPSSLRVDEVHGNSAFYTIIGEQLFQKIIDLEYLNDEQKEYLGI